MKGHEGFDKTVIKKTGLTTNKKTDLIESPCVKVKYVTPN